MGRKRSRGGECICILIACQLIFSVGSCTPLKEEKREDRIIEKKVIEKKIEEDNKEENKEAFELLMSAKRLLAVGYYEGSLGENQKVLSLTGKKPPGDEALFNMGLIYAHSNYPKRDYRRSLDLFKRVLTDYPQSPLVLQANIWIGVLQMIENSKQEFEKAKEEFEKAKQDFEKAKEEVEKAKQVIEKSKEVDIEIEQKKKELSK